MNALDHAPKPLKRLYWKYRLLLWQIHRRYSDSITIKTKQGIFKLPVTANDAISKHLYSRKEFELGLIKNSLAFLRSIGRCPPKGQGTVLDIGANNGVISIGMLATGEFANAIAVEPDPQNFALLQQNVRENNLENQFACLNFAASDQASTLEFELSDSNFGDHRVHYNRPQNSPDLFHESQRRVIQVQAETVDHLIQNLKDPAATNPALVWIDVQGHEGFVFQGAKQLLKKDIPVMVEIWPYGIARTGMSPAEFCSIAADLWSTFWIEHKARFEKRSLVELPAFVDQIGDQGAFKNVIFTK